MTTSCAACLRASVSLSQSAAKDADSDGSLTIEDRFWEAVHSKWFKIPRSPELPKAACKRCGDLALCSSDVAARGERRQSPNAETQRSSPFSAVTKTTTGALYLMPIHRATARYFPSFSEIPSAPAGEAPTLRVVAISDTHDAHFALDVPPGDVLVHAGDILLCSRRFSVSYCAKKLRNFNAWLGTLPHRHKVVVAGNHDLGLQLMGREAVRAILTNATYLEYDELTIVHPTHKDYSLLLFGCPFSRGRSNNAAFQPTVGAQFPFHRVPKRLQDHIAVHGSGGNTHSGPDQRLYDVVVTHAPHMTRAPMPRGDHVQEPQGSRGPHWARVHIGGHLHSMYGASISDATCCVVACSMNDKYAICNPPIVLDVPLQRRI